MPFFLLTSPLFQLIMQVNSFIKKGGTDLIPEKLLINKPASVHILSIAKKQFKGDDSPLFAVTGDLDIESNYGESAVFVAESRIVAIGDNFPDSFISLDFSSISAIIAVVVVFPCEPATPTRTTKSFAISARNFIRS